MKTHLKTLLWLLVFLFLARASVYAQADPKRFLDGVGNMVGAEFDFPSIVKEGKTHVRFVVRIQAHYPGGGLPPTFSFDETLLRAQCNAAFKNGLKGIIVGAEGTRQEMSALYASIRASGDASRLDGVYRQFARFSKLYPSTRMMLEIAAGEPGFTVDAYKYILTGNKDVYAEAQRINQIWIDHLVPIIRAEAPRLTLIIPGCSYSTGYGGINDLLAMVKRPPANSYIDLHFYGPRRYSHNDGVSYPMLSFNWPEPDWKVKVGTEDVKTYDYGWGYKTWDQDGFRANVEMAKTMISAIGGRAYVAEYGTPTPWRAQSAAYRNLAFLEFQRVGWGACEWRG